MSATAPQSYSLVIHPPAPIQGYVNKCKRELYRALNNTWFHSLNSAAHISFVTFITENIEAQIAAVAGFGHQTATLTVGLDGFDSFNDNGAFYLRPDKRSRAALEPVMRAFKEAVCIDQSSYSTNPHISIGRGLTDAQLRIARSLFADEKPALTFECGSLWLRKFNGHKQQYELFTEFPLAGNKTYSASLPQGQQGCLF